MGNDSGARAVQARLAEKFSSDLHSRVELRQREPMLSGKTVILVVEDEAIIRMCAVELVTEAGFEVLEAKCADEAISILETRIDVKLVFTDVEMPGTMDGLKLAHYIRNRWPPIKILAASGKTIIQESQFPPGARFFPKPYADRTIVEAIIDLLGGSDS
jgi:CheY-like chemotaxis protein